MVAGYLILVFFTHMQASVALYQWRCSNFDSVGERFYFPDLGGQDNVLNKEWELSTSGMSYIYPVTASDLTCRGGVVTDVEFCYESRSNDVNNRNGGQVFTLLILAENRGQYTISERLEVNGTPNTDICSNSGRNRRCCERITLDTNSRFSIPMQNFAIGVAVPSPATKAKSQGFLSSEILYKAPSQLISTSFLQNVLSINANMNRGLRLFWLHTTNPTTTIAPSTTESTVPPTDPNTISTSTDASSTTESTVPPTDPNTISTSIDASSTTESTIPPTDPNSISTSSDASSTTESTIPPTDPLTTSISIDTSSTTDFDILTTDPVTSSTSSSIPSTTESFRPPIEAVTNSNFTNANTTLLSTTKVEQNSTTPKVFEEFSQADIMTTIKINRPELIVNTTPQSNAAFQYVPISSTVGALVAFCAILVILALLVIFLLKYKRRIQYSETYDDIMLVSLTNSTDSHYEQWKDTEPKSSDTMKSIMDNQYSDIGPSIHHPIYDSALEGSYTEYDDIYIVPARDISGLYSQLDGMKRQNVCRENIRMGDCIGSGEFGNVYKGVWRRINDSVNVAIKTLKHGSSENDTIKFLQEAAIMTQFRHPNVVNMYGVVKDKEPIMLVLEMLTKGDLRSYLLSMKTVQGELSLLINDHDLLSYCRQVASGMAYLANKKFVHRDLAARNILVSDDGICKIADFGMSRDLMNENYYISHGGKIPVKWTAPEALFYKKYSTASDVWSFGIVMYEIWSMGKKPFENISNAKVIQVVNSGYRLPPPPGCPCAVYDIMMSCWHPEASCRPNFTAICTQLSVSNSKLLHWSPEDKSEYPEATKLGADISCSEKLYGRIQSKYKNV